MKIGTIEITDADLASSTVQPMDGDAVYIVAFTRDVCADFGAEDHGPNGIDRDDHKAAMQQLHNELQEAFDETGIGGNFKILTRTYKGETARNRKD